VTGAPAAPGGADLVSSPWELWTERA